MPKRAGTTNIHTSQKNWVVDIEQPGDFSCNEAHDVNWAQQ